MENINMFVDWKPQDVSSPTDSQIQHGSHQGLSRIVINIVKANLRFVYKTTEHQKRFGKRNWPFDFKNFYIATAIQYSIGG